MSEIEVHELVRKDLIRKLIKGDAHIMPSPYIRDWREKPRSWGKRLFSLPWRPLQKSDWFFHPRAIHFAPSDSYMVSVETFKLLEETLRGLGRLDSCRSEPDVSPL
jgi:hypothetical protein